ncbi:MAG: ABC transporter substrate-binding protein [Rhodospirillaceae bacterium]
MRIWPVLALGLLLVGFAPPAQAQTGGLETEVPFLAPQVASGDLPPMIERLPAAPAIAEFDFGEMPGQYGGQIRTLLARPKDVRQLHVYGYARLVGYDRDLNLRPDILADVDVIEGRIFTLHLRPGHRWSDGHPFTTADFRYWWEDVVQDTDLSLAGAPLEMRVNGQEPVVTILDEVTVRYEWPAPNPNFLPALARPNPLLIYRPAHYLSQFHRKHQTPQRIADLVTQENVRDWVALHFRKDRLYRMDNPEIPSLQPWIPLTEAPADRFVFERNPFYHRIDPSGRQLPYVDRVVATIADGGLIPAKTGAGESDLQGRALGFGNYTFLKQAAERNGYKVHLWKQAAGSHLALYPNLHTQDPVWRSLMREADFRRALSLGINRAELNQVVYYGLAMPQNNSALPGSPLYDPAIARLYTGFDQDMANQLLDGLGLTERDSAGTRLLPDGRPLELVVEAGGAGSEIADILQLIGDSWRGIGVRLLTRPVQVELLKNRVFTGSTLLSVWKGAENGLITPDSAPREFVPTRQNQYQWPAWGQFLETKGMSGEPVDMPIAGRLLELGEIWEKALDRQTRAQAWREILAIHADQQFTIGLVSEVLHPVVISARLRNMPEEGIWNWDPGAHFGLYQPDRFWWDDPERRAETTPEGPS